MIKPTPPVKEILDTFDFDPNAGILTWKSRPVESFKTKRAASVWHTRCLGKNAGGRNSLGHLWTRIGGARFPVHRLIWKIVHGSDATGEIDHINRDPADNRPGNLRDTSPGQNRLNVGLWRHNTSGFNGVNRRGKKWIAEFRIRGQYFFLGSYELKAFAIYARILAERMFCGGFDVISSQQLALQRLGPSKTRQTAPSESLRSRSRCICGPAASRTRSASKSSDVQSSPASSATARSEPQPTQSQASSRDYFPA